VAGKDLRPSARAKGVVEALAAYAPAITKPEMTRLLEEEMDRIAAGQKREVEVVQESREMLQGIFKELQRDRLAIGEALQKQGMDLTAAKILILGVAYKKDVDDTRESPALRIMHLLRERGAAVAYNDPHVPQLPRTRRHDFSGLASVPLERLTEYDCVVIVTDHSRYDFAQIVKEARLLVDTRNATRGLAQAAGKVVYC